MTDLAHPALHARFLEHQAPTDESTKELGLVRRFFDAIQRSRQRQAEKEINRIFARSGRVLTDDVERRMTESLFPNNSWTNSR